MSTQNSRVAKTPESAHAESTPSKTLLSDLSRQQFSLVADSACAMFKGVEAMRKIQQEAAHQASQQYELAAQKIRNASASADFLTIASELMRFDMQEATRYWQQLAAAALEAQVEMTSTTGKLIEPTSIAGLKPVIETWQAALVAPVSQVPAVLQPVLETWQAVIAGSLNGPGKHATTH